MVEDLTHFCKDALHCYRLFYFQPGFTIAGGALHFIPIPQQIPETRWRKTNLRIKHRCSMTAALRRKRYEKYNEVDPDRKYQASYENLIDEPARIREWRETTHQEVFIGPS